MTRFARAAELIGKPVVAVDSATFVGEVRDVLFDPQQVAFVGFTLRGRGLLSAPFAGFLPSGDVRSIGHDAVMIEREDVLVRDAGRLSETIQEQHDALGTEVVADTGESLGRVSDVVLELEAGSVPAIVGYCVERSNGLELIVPAPDGSRNWGEVVVVPASVIQRAGAGLGSFREVLESARQTRSGVGL